MLEKSRYEIGVPQVDANHQEIFERLDQLRKLAAEGNDRQRARNCHALFHLLLEQMRVHFKQEENYMHFIDYNGIERHCMQHALILGFIEHILQKMEDSDYALDQVQQAVGRITSWILCHTIVIDRTIAQGSLNAVCFGNASYAMKEAVLDIFPILLNRKMELIGGNYDGPLVGDEVCCEIELVNRSGLRFLIMIAATPGLIHRALYAIFGSDEEELSELDEPSKVALMEMGMILTDHFMQNYEFGGPFELKYQNQITSDEFYKHQPTLMRIGSLMFTCSEGGGLLFRVWNLPGQNETECESGEFI